MAIQRRAVSVLRNERRARGFRTVSGSSVLSARPGSWDSATPTRHYAARRRTRQTFFGPSGSRGYVSPVRIAYRILIVAVVAAGVRRGTRTASPPFASMTTSRVLLLPAQELTGAADARVWLARFDSVLTARLVEGRVGSGWAYPRDAARFARSNPTYVSDPIGMGFSRSRVTRSTTVFIAGPICLAASRACSR